MSCYEWESGTLILPTAAVAPLKKKIRDALNNHNRQVLAEAIRIHKEIPTRAPGKYAAAVYNHQANRPQPRHAHENTSRIVADAYTLLADLLYEQRTAPRVKQPTTSSITLYTNRDNAFHSNGATLTFDGRTITWEVSENNHAVDHAHASVLGRTLFTALDNLNWTRGTGGTIVGNNEYNRDSETIGGGGNYVAASYGPRGDQQRRSQFRPTW